MPHLPPPLHAPLRERAVTALGLLGYAPQGLRWLLSHHIAIVLQVKSGLAQMLKVCDILYRCPGPLVLTVFLIGRSYHGCYQCRTGGGSAAQTPRPSFDQPFILQARIAEEAGACAVMALERVPADIRAEGKVMSADIISYG